MTRLQAIAFAPVVIAVGLLAGCVSGSDGGKESPSRDGASAAAVRQTPSPPYSYRSQDVTYSNDAGGVVLAGTLTLPKGPGPFPAAILITGSGPQNRDCEVFGHKLFLVIADHLTRRGIAVLRVDDRGVGGSTALSPIGTATSFDFAGDVQAGVSYLRGRPEISPDEIGLVGHSEGGMIAPIVAARDSRIAFVVMLAGPGIPVDELLLLQDERMSRAAGMSEDRIAESRRIQRRVFDVILEDHVVDADQATRLRRLLAGSSAFGVDAPEARSAAIEDLIERISTPWFNAFLRHDPRPTLARVGCPVLALNGELDLQVTCVENLAGVSAALEQGGNLDATVRAFPDLNHPFQHCKTGHVDEYAGIEETISPEVLDVITAWITERFPGGESSGSET